MSENAGQLRITRPDAQELFGFMDPQRSIALAIPERDLAMWRGRKDVVRSPGFFAVRYAIRDDPRYGELIQAVERRRLIAGYALTVLWQVAGYAIQAPTPGLLAIDDRPIRPDQVLGFWRIPVDELDAFAGAIQCLVESGWLRQIDTSDNLVLNTYGHDRARTRTYGPDRARDRDNTSRTGASVDVDGTNERRQTEQNEQNDTIRARGRGAPKQRPLGGSEAATTETNESALQRWDDVRSRDGRTRRQAVAVNDGPPAAARPQASGRDAQGRPLGGSEAAHERALERWDEDGWVHTVVPGRHSYPLSSTEPYRVVSSADQFWRNVPTTHAPHAVAIVSATLRAFRASAGKSPYPAPDNPTDNLQLGEAVHAATRARRMPELLTVLRAACERARSGAYVATALRRQGFLREAEP